MSDKKREDHTSEKYYYLKKWYYKVKDNLTMILLVPTFIGGIWQVFSLLNLGFEYVRFFSVTQLVADGLLMIILIPIVIIFPLISYFFIKSILFDISKNSKGLSAKMIISFLISFVFLISLSYYYFNYISSLFQDEPSTFVELLALLLFLPLIENTIVTGNKISNRAEAYFKVFKKKNKSKLKSLIIWFVNNIYGLFNLVYFVALVFAGMSLIVTFLRTIDSLGDYFISDNLVNVKNVENVVSKEYGLSANDYSVKYFNDSYIFLEHETVSPEEKEKLLKEEKSIPTEIIILEFKNLFNNN
ncbi:hypothetical protein [Winogradskyella sp.]|uniref:hypothetical protein n=1 Tax=Winogradskyella sp. TaxID=1883156 RepID=UPI001B08E865|nr:hypothetical protein [Winogradskyella sp.]MBO6881444.1 hypothetical protein [Winogradskyella sp.]